jgi:capsular exopolysaccharide synthesis family protein
MKEGWGGEQLLDYWGILQRRRWVVYLAVATVTLLALVGSFLVTPLYRGTVTLQIERQNPNILTFKDLASLDYSWSAYTDFYQTQYRILQSDAVARRTVEREGLVHHPSFEGALSPPGLLSRLRSLMPGSAPRTERDPVEVVSSRVKAQLEISPIRNSHLVQVSWIADDPALAARIANAMADSYIQFNLESTYTTSDQATEFLVNQIGTLKREIAAIEDRLQQYGESKRIVSIDDSSNITLKALSDVAQKCTEAQTALAQKEAAYKAMLAAPPEALPEVLHSDLIARLKQEYVTYEADYSEKSRLFKDEWPGMVTLRSKLDAARERLDLETREIASKVLLTAESEYRKAQAEVQKLDQLLREQEDSAQRLKRDAVEFANLQSEVEKKRETLSALIARQNEMALSTRLKDLDATSSNIRVVDRARPPAAPFRPNKRLNLALGLLLGLALGVGMAFFLDYLDNTVQSPQDIEKIAHLPALAVIPHHGPAAAPLSRVRRRETDAAGIPVDLVSHRDGRAGAAEAYRELRTAILLSNAGRPPRQIVITSALPGEGKSAAAVNLAVVLAQLGRSVLLVDSDLRRPRLHRVFEIPNGRGLSTYLSGLETDLSALLVGTDVEHLDLCPSGPIPPNPSELLNSSVFAGLSEPLMAAGYDHVIYDSPPALSVADPVIIASVVDAAVLVLRAGQTPRESLRLAAEKFTQAGIRPIGVVLNDMNAESRHYAHYRYYGRYYRTEAPREGEPEPARKSRAGRA